MTATKLMAGDQFPDVTATTLEGESVTLGKAKEGMDWQMVVVYRGRHCPLCTKYLNQLEGFKARLADNKVDVVAVSADSREQLEDHKIRLEVSFPLYHSLSEDQMKRLGLYISLPRSAAETDHNFAEPGLFVVNGEGKLHVVDLSNNPFVRPELEALVSGLEWIRNPDNDYPIRGTLND